MGMSGRNLRGMPRAVWLSVPAGRRSGGGTRLTVACGVVLLSADQAWACASCFGDPESSMAKGVVAGVLVLVGIVGTVLLGVAGTSLRWIQRGRRLAQMEQAEQPTENAEKSHHP